MRILSTPTNIDFMGKRKLALAMSVTLIVISLLSFVLRGMNFGIDFTGGTLVEVGYPQAIELSKVRSVLEQGGFAGVTVQHFGTPKDVLVRLAPSGEEDSAALSSRAFAKLNEAAQGAAELRRVEFVGPQVGDQLAEDGGLAVLYVLVGILIYVALRFEYRFSLGSVIALIHDVIITVGAFSLFRIEFDLTVLAAILAVIGYSLNDTIVVFDRIRENFRKMRKGSPEEIMNGSINQTLSRTLVTSGTTLLVLVALFIFGGKIIHGFALALIIGIVIGTYSSIYIASTAALMLGVSRQDLMQVKKEGAEVGSDGSQV